MTQLCCCGAEEQGGVHFPNANCCPCTPDLTPIKLYHYTTINQQSTINWSFTPSIARGVPFSGLFRTQSLFIPAIHITRKLVCYCISTAVFMKFAHWSDHIIVATKLVTDVNLEYWTLIQTQRDPRNHRNQSDLKLIFWSDLHLQLTTQTHPKCFLWLTDSLIGVYS